MLEMKTKRKPTGAAAMGAGPGRPKGVPNKVTIQVKAAIEKAADGLGGYQRLIEWSQEDPANERLFWASIWPKLLPLQLTGAEGAPLVPPTIQFVRGAD